MKNPNHYKYQKEIKISWGDMDAFGHVNNVVYARYFEMVRADYFSHLGLWEDDGKNLKQGMVIVNLNIDFRKQTTYPSILRAYLKTCKMGTKSFKMNFLMLDSRSEPVITAKGTFVWYDFLNNSSAILPKDIREKILNYEGDI